MIGKEEINTLTEEEIYTLYLKSELEKSMEDLENGQVMTLEESKERLQKEYENCNIK